MIKTFQCYCEYQVEIDVPENVELTKEVEQSIIDGTFMSTTCERCERVLKPEFNVTFVQQDTRGKICFIPESERHAVMSGKRDVAESYRVVIGYTELVEKIKILQSGLDDSVIEVIKYHYLEKAPKDADINIYFHDKTEDGLEFYIHGLKKDEIGITRIGLDFYNTMKQKIEPLREEEPYSEFLSPPYVSIKRIYLAG